MSKKWKEKEKRDMKSFKARQMPRSGGLWFAKGDVSNEKFLIESKTSKKNRFSITKQIWNKIYREAIVAKKMPVLSVEFGDKNIEVVVLDRNDLEIIATKIEKTNKKSFSITTKIWEEMCDDSTKKLPCLLISFLKYNIDLVILDKNDFISLLESKNGTNK